MNLSQSLSSIGSGDPYDTDSLPFSSCLTIVRKVEMFFFLRIAYMTRINH